MKGMENGKRKKPTQPDRRWHETPTTEGIAKDGDYQSRFDQKVFADAKRPTPREIELAKDCVELKNRPFVLAWSNDSTDESHAVIIFRDLKGLIQPGYTTIGRARELLAKERIHRQD